MNECSRGLNVLEALMQGLNMKNDRASFIYLIHQKYKDQMSHLLDLTQ